MAREYSMPFFETSAKNGTKVKDAFHAILKDIVERQMAAGAAGAGGAGAPTASGRVAVTRESKLVDPEASGRKCTIM